MNISLKGAANINISLTSHELFEARPNIRLMTIIAVGDFIISSTHLQLEIRQEDKGGEWKKYSPNNNKTKKPDANDADTCHELARSENTAWL
jgi:hypothetical protein